MTDVPDTTWNGTLRSGLAVTVRSVRPDDRERIATAFRNLDKASVYTRMFSYKAALSDSELDRMVNVDPRREVALVVTTGAGADETIIATARYIELEPQAGKRAAEVAFVVEEDYQGQGIAGRLLGALARRARANGVERFEAEVLTENRAMLAVFAKSGMPMSRRQDGDVVHVALSLEPSPESPGAQ